MDSRHLLTPSIRVMSTFVISPRNTIVNATNELMLHKTKKTPTSEIPCCFKKPTKIAVATIDHQSKIRKRVLEIIVTPLFLTISLLLLSSLKSKKVATKLYICLHISKPPFQRTLSFPEKSFFVQKNLSLKNIPPLTIFSPRKNYRISIF